MSGLDGLQLDADGFLDMSQFPDDGTDLADAELDQLREALHSDPVEEPTAEQWDAMFDDVVTADDTGPFALDDVEGLAVEADLDAGDDAFGLDDAAADEPAVDDADDLGLDDVTADDLDLDVPDLDGGLDLAPVDDGDDIYSPDVVDDAPAEVANNDFEDLL